MTGNKRYAFFFTFWLLAMGLMASQIERHLLSGKTAGQSKDPLYLLLGSAKEAIGDTFFLKANSYFHGGVDTNLLQHEEIVEHDVEEGHPLETFKKSTTDWVYRVNSQVKVLEHKHLEGEQTREILPFLKAAIALDPYNVPAILTTAYWLDNYFKKTDAAIKVLKQGLKDNPDSWEIRYHLGLNYLKYKKSYTESAGYFEEALKKMNQENSNAIDHREAYYFLAESYKNEGLKTEALEAYHKALGYFKESENLPVKTAIKEKIKRLSESGA